VIISQTPYRVSFAGGGTDLPAFYRQEWGAVLSMAVRKYMYVTVGRRFDKSIRVAYTRTDFADTVAEVQHTLVREALRVTGLVNHLEITTIGDVPAGTGMGSSSSLTVGLLNAMYAHSGRIVGPARLAEESCRIEIETLGKPIGKQDQYAAAYGGLNYIRFNTDGTVEVEPTPCRADILEELERRLMLVYTAQTRSADEILKKQSEGTADKMGVLRRMRDLAGEMRTALGAEGDIDAFGRLLDEGWQLKRSLGFGISGEHVDAWYEAARRAGAQGGKLLGAGGGGFLLLMAPRERHETIRDALGRPKEIDCRFDRRGSRIVFISDQQ
jgi:D-glycero-alpha-D-manno-heptose-7-phosphate kinase